MKTLKGFIRCLLPACVCIAAFAQAPVPTALVLPAPVSAVPPAPVSPAAVPNEPVTGVERLTWFADYTFGPPILLGSAITAGYSTEMNHPHEYGTHWKGFADRYGMQVASVATSNAMEAGLGAIWGEDPRYFRAGGQEAFRARVGHVFKWTFAAPDRNGTLRPAYARYLAISGSSFLENTWVVPSDSNTKHALDRTALGILAHIAGNAFHEFWPDVKQKVFHTP